MPGVSQSRIAAKLQDIVARRREEVGLYKEIADELPLADAGRLLHFQEAPEVCFCRLRPTHGGGGMAGVEGSAGR